MFHRCQELSEDHKQQRPVFLFWGAIDRLIHLQKTNSISALRRLINEAAREISENAVKRAVANFNRRVHLCIRNNGAHFEAEM